MFKTTGAVHLQEGEGLGCFARILPFELVRFHTFRFTYASTHVTWCHVMSCHVMVRPCMFYRLHKHTPV